MPCGAYYAAKEPHRLPNSEIDAKTINVSLLPNVLIMGNVQGRKHRRRRGRKARKPNENMVCDKLIFIDRDDGMYVWETHVVGHLPLKEPEEPEIVFYGDKLWQDDTGWSLIVLMSDSDELSDEETVQL